MRGGGDARARRRPQLAPGAPAAREPGAHPLRRSARSIPDGRRVHRRRAAAGRAQPNNRRFGVAVVGGGYHGVLTSPSTRIPGIVSIADIATTALGRYGRSARTGEQAIRSATSRRSTGGSTTTTAGGRARRRGSSSRSPGSRSCRAPRPSLGAAAFLLANLALGASTSRPAVAFAAAARSRARGRSAFARRRPRPGVLAALMAGVLAAYLVSFELDGAGWRCRRSGRRRTPASTGSRTCSRRSCSCRRSSAPRCSRRRPGPLRASRGSRSVTIAGSRFGADGGGAIVLGGRLRGARRRCSPAPAADARSRGGGRHPARARPARARRSDGASSHVDAALRRGPDRPRRRSLGSRHAVMGPPDGEHVHGVATALALAMLAALVARALARAVRAVRSRWRSRRRSQHRWS